MFSFYTHNRHGQESRENLGARGTLRVLQPPVFVRVAQEVAELPNSPVVRDIELGAVRTIGIQLYLLSPVFCNESPAACARESLDDVQGSVELPRQIGRSKAAVGAQHQSRRDVGHIWGKVTAGGRG